jgi:hypothetical protein
MENKIISIDITSDTHGEIKENAGVARGKAHLHRRPVVAVNYPFVKGNKCR